MAAATATAISGYFYGRGNRDNIMASTAKEVRDLKTRHEKKIEALELEFKKKVEAVESIMLKVNSNMERLMEIETARKEFVSKEVYSVTHEALKRDIARLQETDEKIFKLLGKVSEDVSSIASQIAESRGKCAATC
jgi:tetrahydromethanopterin S-methyltransferase subunit G